MKMVVGGKDACKIEKIADEVSNDESGSESSSDVGTVKSQEPRQASLADVFTACPSFVFDQEDFESLTVVSKDVRNSLAGVGIGLRCPCNRRTHHGSKVEELQLPKTVQKLQNPIVVLEIEKWFFRDGFSCKPDWFCSEKLKDLKQLTISFHGAGNVTYPPINFEEYGTLYTPFDEVIDLCPNLDSLVVGLDWDQPEETFAGYLPKYNGMFSRKVEFALDTLFNNNLNIKKMQNVFSSCVHVSCVTEICVQRGLKFCSLNSFNSVSGVCMLADFPTSLTVLELSQLLLFAKGPELAPLNGWEVWSGPGNVFATPKQIIKAPKMKFLLEERVFNPKFDYKIMIDPDRDITDETRKHKREYDYWTLFSEKLLEIEGIPTEEEIENASRYARHVQCLDVTRNWQWSVREKVF